MNNVEIKIGGRYKINYPGHQIHGNIGTVDSWMGSDSNPVLRFDFTDELIPVPKIFLSKVEGNIYLVKGSRYKFPDVYNDGTINTQHAGEYFTVIENHNLVTGRTLIETDNGTKYNTETNQISGLIEELPEESFKSLFNDAVKDISISDVSGLVIIFKDGSKIVKSDIIPLLETTTSLNLVNGI